MSTYSFYCTVFGHKWQKTKDGGFHIGDDNFYHFDAQVESLESGVGRVSSVGKVRKLL